MDIEKLKQRLIDIVKERDDIEQQLQDAFIEAIKATAIENPLKDPNNKYSSHITIVKRSDLDGKPWSPSFFNWEQSVNTVLDFLKKKSAAYWKEMLEEKLKESKSGVVEFKKVVKAWPYNYTEKTPVDAKFIEKIIEKL